MSDELLKIHTYPDPVLRERASSITDIDGQTQDLIERMVECMYAAPGIGLAANQVGRPQRLIVFDRCPEEADREPCALINPEVVQGEGEIVYEEACLSVVDFSAEVTRKASIQVRGVDRHGRPMEFDAEGLLAICLQHEIDHLDGILFIDHISSLKRALYQKETQEDAAGQ